MEQAAEENAGKRERGRGTQEQKHRGVNDRWRDEQHNESIDKPRNSWMKRITVPHRNMTDNVKKQERETNKQDKNTTKQRPQANTWIHAKMQICMNE